MKYLLPFLLITMASCTKDSKEITYSALCASCTVWYVNEDEKYVDVRISEPIAWTYSFEGGPDHHARLEVSNYATSAPVYGWITVDGEMQHDSTWSTVQPLVIIGP